MSTRAATTLPPAPTEASLRAAAIRHLARYAATRMGLMRVLDRRVERWQRAARAMLEADEVAEAGAASRAAVREVVAALAASGALDDAAFADSRARLLLRSGRSRRTVARHLAARGIEAALIGDAVPEDAERELAAALLLLHKRRIRADDRQRALGILARAGFSHDTACVALAIPDEEACARIERMRRG